MKIGDAAIELAERRVEAERDAGVARIRAKLAGTSGRLVCDCGNPIGELRRRAMPNTDTCIDCATFLERQPNRRRA
ncbi:MAG: TraR/DksA C4-type zinc finger protein [Rhizobiaceae bacterium]|nr:TraR/DksA C4-type zinc finger protein [Rhizobiaceae bacterium]